jgi:hypothetical protein
MQISEQKDCTSSAVSVRSKYSMAYKKKKHAGRTLKGKKPE